MPATVVNATQALSNLRVLVTRPQHQAQSFITDIEYLGGQAFHLPTIEIVYSNRVPDLTDSDLIIFTSINSVVGAKMQNMALDKKVFNNTLVAAIGTATARALREAGLKNVLSPVQNGNSETLLKILQPHVVADMNVTIVRGDSGRNTLRDRLNDLGANVRYAQTYERKLPDTRGKSEKPGDLWRQANPHIVSISSDLGLANLITLLPARDHLQLLSKPLVVNSARCMKKARAAGFREKIVVADPPGNCGQLKQLREYAQSRNRTNQ